MYAPKLNTTQSLTGQSKIQSLNVIYNRVTLLKSKNVSRRLIQKDSSMREINSQNENNLHNGKDLSHQFRQVQSIIPKQSRISTNQLMSKHRFLQDRETDNIQTNFWPSQNIIKISNKQDSFLSKNTDQLHIPKYNEGKPRRKYFSTKQGVQNISKTIQVPSKFKSNRQFLMSDFSRNTIKQTPKQFNQSKNSQTIIKPQSETSVRKRPMTSSITRQPVKFRTNQLSRHKTRVKLLSQAQQNKPVLLSQAKQDQRSSKKSLNSSRVSLIKGETRASVYKNEISKFQTLYECLSAVLSSIKQGLFQVQKAVSQYSNFIQARKLAFVDDFMEGRQEKLQKTVRATRLHETLSICYLFLQIAQQKITDQESYLVNFIGHSLSNLLLVIRLYIIKEGRQQFEKSQFQKALQSLQISSFGQLLTSTSDVLLRIQHNNEIITMIHKRLGRHNQKFQQCIQNFLKHAERKRYSCSLCAHYIFQYLAMHIHELELLDISPTLQMAPQPYTPPASKQYTLVIQPLGILQKNGKPRPYLHQFMKWASKNFDVVLWTWQLPVPVAQLVQMLSPFIVSRLYRHHCTVEDGIFVKDISRLGRNLQKTIIIDFDKRIYSPHPSNGIECRWRGNSSDKNLLVLSQIFQQMVNSSTSIPDTLTFYAQQIFSIKGY